MDNQDDPSVLFAHGLPSEHTDDIVLSYTMFRLGVYRNRHDWKGDLLLEFYQEDFEKFTQPMFRGLPYDLRRDLRTHLISKGVKVPTGQNISIPHSLFHVLSAELTDSPQPTEIENGPRQQIPEVNSNAPRTTPDGSGSTSSQGSSYALSSVMKAYSSPRDKFTGALSDNLDKKLTLFVKRCELSGVPEWDRTRALWLMLEGAALQHYFKYISNTSMSFDEAVSNLRERFLTQERTLTLTREWDSTSLLGYLKRNPEKKRTEVLEMMVARLKELQECLPVPYNTDVILKNKLLTACDGVDECRLARQKVAPTLEGVIADLHTSISTMSDIKKPPDYGSSSAAALLTERRRFSFNRKGGYRKGKSCFVCKKVGCWSSNHTPAERMAALRKNKAARVYILENLKDSDSDEERGEIEDAVNEVEDLQALILNVGQPEDNVDNGDLTDPSYNPTSDGPRSTQAFAAEMMDIAALHAINKDKFPSAAKRYGSSEFYGIAVDTCCNYHSTGGRNQYIAYCKFVGIEPTMSSPTQIGVKFGVGTTAVTGIAKCYFVIESQIMNFDLHIVEADIPLLLSLADLDRLKLVYNNLNDTLTHIPTKSRAKITRTFGHPFILWDPFRQCLFTESELRRLHRRFGHPHAEKLINVLRRADPSNVDENTRTILKKIAAQCRQCQFHTQRPRRFKFSLRAEKDFNKVVYIDIVTIDKKPVLHVVDEATRYQAAKWLRNYSTNEVWRALRMSWIDVYLGPPDVLAHDAGKQLMATQFQQNSALMSIKTKPIPIEAPFSMTYVERYHDPLRRAYKIIKAELPSSDPEEALQYAVKSLNDSVGPDGLVPTLLVYGALPRLGLPTDKPAPGTMERAVAVRKASESMSRYFARRQVRDALRTPNGPNVTDIHQAPLGSHVLVYRTHKDRWEGPFALLGLEAETCTILCPDGPKEFRTTVVKPYKYPVATESPSESPDSPVSQDTPEPTAYLTFSSDCYDENEIEGWCRDIRDVQDSSVFIGEINSSRANQFKRSREKEVMGLLEKGVFEPVPKSAAHGHRVYGSRFVDDIKNEGTSNAFEKSRLVVQAFNDRGHGLLTYSPTVQRSSQRMLFCMAAMCKNWTVMLRDVVQAYTQSETPLTRPIYVRPVAEFGLSDDMLLLVKQPLYGVPEAGLFWFHTYHEHHTSELGLCPSSHDLCLLYTPKAITRDASSSPAAMTCLQTDDTLSLANESFCDLENVKSVRFKSKPSCKLAEGSPLKFNGMILERQNNGIKVTAAVSSRKLLSHISTDDVSKDEYVSQRARGAFIAGVCRPDLSFGFAFAAQVKIPDAKAARALNNLIDRCNNLKTNGLFFKAIDLDSLSVAVFIDASFANNSDLTSQLGFLTVMMDNKANVNVLHYGSVKSKRITRSALAAELYAMVFGFDQSYVLHKSITEFLGRRIALRIYTDSLSLFESLTTLNTTSEKRLLIDLSMLRESYERREIADVFWIPGPQNPADGLTKKNPCTALVDLMETNKVHLTPKAWIDRKPPHWAEKISSLWDKSSFANSKVAPVSRT